MIEKDDHFEYGWWQVTSASLTHSTRASSTFSSNRIKTFKAISASSPQLCCPCAPPYHVDDENSLPMSMDEGVELMKERKVNVAIVDDVFIPLDFY